MDLGLTAKRALVTGSSRGLGKAMAIALAEAGADVVCASSKTGGADETAKCVESLGRRAWQVSADLADRQAVLRMADDAQSQAGAIDILVNNGGTIARQPAVDYSEAEWDRVVNTDLDSVWFLSQYFGRGMVERRTGKIINIASVLSFSGGITVPAYTASKHAVAGLTKALANEWARHNVQVNAIAPGVVLTERVKKLLEGSKDIVKLAATHLLGLGLPIHMADMAVYLASDESAITTGQVISVDSGATIR